MIFALIFMLAQVASSTGGHDSAAPLSAEQRAAADRLLDATGAPARRGPLIDEVVEQVVGFSLVACQAVARAKPAAGCAERLKVAQQLRAEMVASRPALLSRIIDVQERAYASRLSIADMDAVTAFAKTTAGRTFFEQVQPAAVEAATESRKIILEDFLSVSQRLEATYGDKSPTVELDK